MENQIDRKALCETYIILSKLNLFNKLPLALQEFIKENRDINHKFSFNSSIPLFNQLKNDSTKNLVAYIYTKYINDSEESNQFIKKEILNIINKLDK